jgi:hypothetical protein
METTTYTDEKGRHYLAFSNGEGAIIIKGPPEGLVDDLKLPEPFATTLHNILFARKIYTYSDASKAGNGLMGALQEALLLDAQKLLEVFFRYESK